MARPCTVCGHPQRAEIDRLLLTGNVKVQTIATEFGVHWRALYRHKAHLVQTLGLAPQAPTVADADSLLAQLTDLQERTLAILTNAEHGDDKALALKAITEARRNLELLGKLAGELQTQPTVNVVFTQEWIQVRAVVLQALAPYADARQAVAEALRELES